MTEIKKGQRYRDNDPRMPGRILKVIDFEADPNDIYRTKAVCLDRTNREFRIDTSRMYTDGKPRRSGFSFDPSIQE